jgi:crotonobetainyl-CoA:carnitine CoA-transferase CaiB-like acyl-CoA transferase
MTDRLTALKKIWALADGETSALEQVTLSGDDPILPSLFKVGTAASVSIAAPALMAAEIWRLRGGHRQNVTVAMRAAAAAFRSERYQRIDNRPAHSLWNAIAGFYRTADDRWIQLHTNFPHHRDGVLQLLGCGENRDEVAAAISHWHGQVLEDALVGRGLCAALIRSPDEWQQHPQAQAVAALPLLEIINLGDSPAESLPAAGRPLSDVRVLDLTRIIAGPVCGRALAEHGAEVMRISAPHLPSIPELVIDTGRGKLSAWLDLRDEQDKQQLRRLIEQADIFVQGYRPGAIAGHGFSPQEVAALRPGIVYVTLCAYSHAGPWAQRRGYDSLVQSASGIAWEEGRTAGKKDGPQHLPAQALDHATGYLAAFGAMTGLARRMQQGGSWLVRVSLAQTGRWIDSLGRVDGLQQPDLRAEDISDLLQTSAGPFGQVTHVAPAAQLSATPAYWARPSVPLGTHAPQWLQPE